MTERTQRAAQVHECTQRAAYMHGLSLILPRVFVECGVCVSDGVGICESAQLVHCALHTSECT